jgi:hypothetical protein
MADNQRMSANQLHVLGTLDRMCTRGDACPEDDEQEPQPSGKNS